MAMNRSFADDVFNEAIVCALWLGIEDYAGLWEVAWDLRGNALVDETAIEQLAHEVVDELVRSRYIELYAVQEPNGRPRKLDADSYGSVLADSSNWLASSLTTGTTIRFGTTELGENAYRVLLPLSRRRREP